MEHKYLRLIKLIKKANKETAKKKAKLMKLPVNKWYKIGDISVDSGQIGIADGPIPDDLYLQNGDVYPFKKAHHGVVFMSGYGDGTYKVFAKFNKERRIKEVKIVLIED